MLRDQTRPGLPPSPLQIAVVDDDPLFLETFAANLKKGGYRVATFTGTKAILAEWFGGMRPRAVLVEERSASRDNAALPRALRSAGYTGPIVTLTPATPNSVEGEWIAKTLPPPVILRQLARVVGGTPTETVELGRLVLREDTGEALWTGEIVPLSQSEFSVVALFADRAGLTIGYREIFDVIQSDLFASGAVGEGYRMFVRAAVERIRQKFRALDGAFDAIEHTAGLGYRWRL
jgi:two-component system response regulator ChvI